MNYAEIQSFVAAGTAFFSDSVNCVIIKGGGVKFENGVEVDIPEERITAQGVIRDVHARDINGDTIRVNDKRGIFTHEVEIEKGNWIEVDQIRYVVVDERAIKPSGTVVAYRPILRRVAAHG